jgi:glutaredoxin
MKDVAPPKITLYTRVGCHLCDDAKGMIDRLSARIPLELEVVDIDGDPELKARYDWEVPVILIDGKKAAKLRVDETALERRLRSLR